MSFSYYIVLGMVFLAPANTSADETSKRKKYTGTITEENGKPLPGATVMIEGTTIGTISDSNGQLSD